MSNRFRKPPQKAMPNALPQGTIVNPQGNVVVNAPEYSFAEENARPDEIVYWIHEAFAGPQKLGLEPQIGPGFVFVTMKLPDGKPEDVGCIMLRGSTPPPQGTRFALRMLGPEETYKTKETQYVEAEISEEERPAEQVRALPAARETQATSAATEAGRLALNPEAAAVVGEANGRASLDDDPEWDATDFAHPAWWRGDDHGALSVVQIVNGLLDGKPHKGTYGNPEIEKLARRIILIKQYLLDCQTESMP